MSSLTGILQALAAAILLAVPVSSQTATATLGAKGAEIADIGGGVVVTVPLSRPVAWSVRIADDPPRLVVGLRGVEWGADPVSTSASIATVETLRTGADTSQIEAVLREPLAIVTAEMRTDEDGSALLQVQLHPTTATDFRAGLTDQVFAGPGPVVIALDPGHGGFDPGARAGDHIEADLVLEFAQRLKQSLEATGRFDVVLTRDGDEFVSLEERLSIARLAGATAFLSLHADALEDAGAASGLVVYGLDPNAEAAAAQKMTEQHGPGDLLTGLDLTGAGDDVALALLSLARSQTAPRADALSSGLVAAFKGAGLAVNSHPRRKGDFSVLKAADIPSVLVELGFLSTEADLARLTSEEWQGEAATAIRDALLLWADEDRLR